MKQLLVQTLSASFLVSALAAQPSSAGSGEHFECHAKRSLSYADGKVSYTEEGQEPKVLASKKLSQTTFSRKEEICINKDGRGFGLFSSDILVNVEHDNPWQAGKKTTSLFLCEAFSDSYPNQNGIDTTCVTTHTTTQTLKDTTLKTEYFVDGKQVDKLPE